MKPLLILFTLLLLISFQSLGQSLNVVKNLGKINFADSADLVLSAKIEGGIFTYELLDVTKPETPVFAFSLVTNSLEAFKESVKAKLQAAEKTFVVPDNVLEKYYYFFLNQNPFLIEDKPGGVAMEMFFSDSITVYNFKHNDFTRIKKNDIFELLNSLVDTIIVKEEFDKSVFEYTFYKNLEIKVNSGRTKLFDEKFEARLREIENFSPKSLIWEELYKEIHYRYYLALTDLIEKVVSGKEKKNNEELIKIQESISRLQARKRDLVMDTTNLKRQISENISLISNSRSKIAELNLKIQTPLELINPEEIDFSDDLATPDIWLSKFINNLNLARSYGDRMGIVFRSVNFTLLNPTNIEELYSSDLAIIQQKITDLRELGIENVKINDLGNIITQNQEKIQSNVTLLIQVEKDLESQLIKIGNLRSTVLTAIKSELNSLENSNKFHFKARNIQLEFNRGYLENIVVIGESTIFIEPELAKYKLEIPLEESTLKFVNDYPIGISAKRDIERLGDIKLYARYQDDVHYEMRIGDLIINIKEILALDRTDYSPKDGVIEVNLLTEKRKEFAKSDTKEILQLKVFSDFVGLQEENPNGLIQFEVDKEIPLVTNRLTKPYLGPIRFLIKKDGNVGFLNFIKPRFVYSKIEENNSSLNLKSISVAIEDSNPEQVETRLGASSLSIKQFERFSIGLDLNLFLYNIPYGKSTFLLNAGMHFGRTDFTDYDSVPAIIKYPRAYTNTYQPSLELLWRVTGDERYGLELSYGINWIISDQINFAQVSNTNEVIDNQIFRSSDTQYGIQRLTILAYLNINSNTSGRMFFRYRSNSELWNFKNNYSQLQIGYTTYLTKKTE